MDPIPRKSPKRPDFEQMCSFIVFKQHIMFLNTGICDIRWRFGNNEILWQKINFDAGIFSVNEVMRAANDKLKIEFNAPKINQYKLHFLLYLKNYNEFYGQSFGW